MIGPCACYPGYFCVSCRVKRGDYTGWRTTPAKPRQICSASECNRMADTAGKCWKHYNNQQWRKKHPIPQTPYVKLADR